MLFKHLCKSINHYKFTDFKIILASDQEGSATGNEVSDIEMSNFSSFIDDEGPLFDGNKSCFYKKLKYHHDKTKSNSFQLNNIVSNDKLTFHNFLADNSEKNTSKTEFIKANDSAGILEGLATPVRNTHDSVSMVIPRFRGVDKRLSSVSGEKQSEYKKSKDGYYCNFHQLKHNASILQIKKNDFSLPPKAHLKKNK